MSIEDARERLEKAEQKPYSTLARQDARLSQAHALIAIYEVLVERLPAREVARGHHERERSRVDGR